MKAKCEFPSLPRSSVERIYLELVWDHELEAASRIMENLANHREEVLTHWHELYVLHFREKRALSQSEFLQVAGADLDATVETLRAKAIDRFVAEMQQVGELLVQHNVPFSEVVASVHLFEESVIPIFPPSAALASYLLFDKISHCRIIVLADTYFRSHAALAGARIRLLERDMAQMPRQARSQFHELVGATLPMRRLYERIEALATVRAPVLIIGEQGTGKELAARAIHGCSPNAKAPFIALNCAALPPDFMERELFGHGRGAFRSANGEHPGMFRWADGGALFLDEITELSAEAQDRLLEVLTEHTVRPTGATHKIPVEVRVIAATGRDPEEAVRTGRLREELCQRLQVNVLRMPPLRERRGDIPLLVEHFIALFNEKLGRSTPIIGIQEDALEAMCRYSWAGNVRELSNAVQAAVTFGRSHLMEAADLPAAITNPPLRQLPQVPQGRGPVSNFSFTDIERDLVRRALESTEGNKHRAAKLLGFSRKKLYAKIAKYGI